MARAPFFLQGRDIGFGMEAGSKAELLLAAGVLMESSIVSSSQQYDILREIGMNKTDIEDFEAFTKTAGEAKPSLTPLLVCNG